MPIARTPLPPDPTIMTEAELRRRFPNVIPRPPVASPSPSTRPPGWQQPTSVNMVNGVIGGPEREFPPDPSFMPESWLSNPALVNDFIKHRLATGTGGGPPIGPFSSPPLANSTPPVSPSSILGRGPGRLSDLVDILRTSGGNRPPRTLNQFKDHLRRQGSTGVTARTQGVQPMSPRLVDILRELGIEIPMTEV